MLLDETNRPVWDSWASQFADADSWTDRGERAAIASIADEVRGKAILDVGVGAGRSTWLLRLLSAHYVAVDYTPAMVDLCRRNHPDVDVRKGDARRLTEMQNKSFDLVVFSFNGLDAISHDDRGSALGEFWRVLRPGGLLLFSTLNKDGPAFGEAPWQVGRGQPTSKGRLYRTVKVAGTFPYNANRYAHSYRNWWRGRTQNEDHGSWGISLLSAHDFGLLVHYNTLPGQRMELLDAGFSLRDVWKDSGERVAETDHSTAVYHHLVAEKVED